MIPLFPSPASPLLYWAPAAAAAAEGGSGSQTISSSTSASTSSPPAAAPPSAPAAPRPPSASIRGASSGSISGLGWAAPAISIARGAGGAAGSARLAASTRSTPPPSWGCTRRAATESASMCSGRRQLRSKEVKLRWPSSFSSRWPLMVRVRPSTVTWRSPGRTPEASASMTSPPPSPSRTDAHPSGRLARLAWGEEEERGRGRRRKGLGAGRSEEASKAESKAASRSREVRRQSWSHPPRPQRGWAARAKGSL
mmetsp:Transcript_568/g.1793  ORF Transcript_568/g.1793 Transcript_568/m.1793 type:complete len:254 (-) Transcript_568:155-916(-)